MSELTNHYDSAKACIALLVIEEFLANRCNCRPSMNPFVTCEWCQLYVIAHSASKCGSSHGWFTKTKAQYDILVKHGGSAHEIS